MPVVIDYLARAQLALSGAKSAEAVLRARSKAFEGENTAGWSRGQRETYAGECTRLREDVKAAAAATAEAGRALARAEYDEARFQLQLKWQITPVPESGAGEHNARSAFGYGVADPLDVALADGDGERLVTLHLAGRGQKPPAGSTYLDHLRAS